MPDTITIWIRGNEVSGGGAQEEMGNGVGVKYNYGLRSLDPHVTQHGHR
jgi:hypothetical protein